MVSVTLTQIGEFMAELDRDLTQLGRPIVRVSKVTRPTMGSTLTAVSVEAGYVVAGEVVRLRLYAGSLWGVENTDAETQDRATALLREIEDGIADRGLQVRAGLYDEIVEGRSSGGGARR
jgi:hypothetical protein